MQKQNADETIFSFTGDTVIAKTKFLCKNVSTVTLTSVEKISPYVRSV